MNGAIINRPKKLILSSIYIIFLLTIPCGALVAGKLEDARIPDEVLTELAYLLKFIGTENEAPNFEPGRIANLLGFVAKQNTNSRLYHDGTSFGLPSAYYGLDINRSLEDVLRYVYNPSIPYCSIAPSTVRICQLKETNKGQKSWPLLWKLLPDLDKPIVIRGVERVTNTPDLFSGAYYSYDQDRTLILFKYQDRKILASISKQKGKSDVGKKGLVLGTDDSWDYIYTGEEGLTKSGLNWVRSYMYDSFGIALYHEINPSKPLVRCGIFKWVRAGWAKMNVVRPEHIYNGMERFAKA